MDEISKNKTPEVLERTLLIVDDDERFRNRLARAMESRNFTVTTAGSVQEGKLRAQQSAPAFAILDLRLADGSGLDVVTAIKAARAESRILLLTGYANIATVAAALKAEAIDYLAKPADADDIEAALLSKVGLVNR